MSPLVPMPALANAMSSRPNASTAVWASCSTSSSDVTSHSTTRDRVAEALLHLVEAALVHVADGDARALAHEALDGREPDARAASGDDRHSILEPHAGAFSTVSSGAIS